MNRVGLQSLESPFRRFTRDEWAQLRADTQLTLTIDDLRKLQSTHDPISLDEVVAIYLPLSRLLALYVAATQGLFKATQRFLGATDGKVPYIIGIAGSVAAGKSTTARVLQALLTRWPNTPQVQLVTTDGFLRPNAELIRLGIMDRKGFPESYDGTAVLRFLSAVKAGQHNVAAPVYSHITYDIVKGESIIVDRPDILIFEGINVLLPNRLPRDGKEIPFVSDFFDFSIFLDADDRVAGAMVHRTLHELADDGVPRSAQLFPPIRRPQRCGSRGDGALDLAAHQSRQPAREYPADPAARRLAPDQGRKPPDRRSGAEKAVSVWWRSALSACACFIGALTLSLAHAEPPKPCQGSDLTQVEGLAAAEAARADDLVNGDGLLWRIEKPGLAPSYSLRHHSFDRRVRARSRAARRAIDQRRQDRGDRTRRTDRRRSKKPTSRPRRWRRRSIATMTHSRAPSRPRTARKSRNSSPGLGYPAEFAHHLKPWFLAILTGLPKCEAERESSQSARGRPVSRRDGERLGGEGHWT